MLPIASATASTSLRHVGKLASPVILWILSWCGGMRGALRIIMVMITRMKIMILVIPVRISADPSLVERARFAELLPFASHMETA